MKKSTNKIFKITIGIPAHNEESNIYRLLKSLASQQFPENFKLESIKVLSDGSNDKTADKVKSVKDERIKLYDYPQRLGKNARLNQLFNSFNGDILVLLDADILISDKKVIANLTESFSRTKKLGFVAGNAQPLDAKTIVERAVNNFVQSLNFMKSRINNGNNIYSVRGPIVALSKDFAKKITLPINVPDDRYLYLKCRQLNFKFKYSEKALIYFRSPQTIKDQMNQGFRFMKDKKNLYRYFDNEFINNEYFVPINLKIQMFLYQVIKNPLAYLTMKLIHLQIISNRNKQQDHKWQMVLSSKRIV